MKETQIALGGGVAAQMLAVIGSDFVILTFLPALVGAGFHAINQFRKSRLTFGDFLMSLSSALAIGVWGGPWVASIMPQSEVALPIMCYASAYFSKSFMALLKSIFIGLAKRLGGNA